MLLEFASLFKVLVNFYQTTWHYIPEICNLQTKCLKLFACVEDEDKLGVRAFYKCMTKITVRKEDKSLRGNEIWNVRNWLQPWKDEDTKKNR
jgi:hypothetical protein